VNTHSDQSARPARRPSAVELEPILVSVPTAKRLLDIGNTKVRAIVKAGKVDIGTGRRSVS
jgi:hypothetical protein